LQDRDSSALVLLLSSLIPRLHGESDTWTAPR